MIVLSESTEQIERSPSANENKLMTDAAQLLGCKVYHIPRDFERCGKAENALWHIPNYPQETAAIWIGYIPEFERYEAIYQAALAKGIKLINTPLEHRTALEFDLFYPPLKGLTPDTLVITSTNECIEAGELLGFPVFVKGSVQSRKMQGWKSCIANNQEELLRLTECLLKLKYYSRGRVIVRKLVKLWHKRLAPNGFPMGREFRCFIYNQEILKYGYYWDDKNDFGKLSKEEEKQVLSLAVIASQRLKVPYLAIDIGQLESGEWIVIETADAQFAGLCQIPALELWNKLKDISY
ncbi:MAG: ATP-grasp domain-containing protein [Nostoc sp. DedQUE01]|nr:ATP-grasp domain-containing protein [Nostoc sp. DedQUE01]